MKRVLMIAYHFPPLAGGSGIQRTLRFVQQLPACGWQPLVLSVHCRAYEQVDDAGSGLAAQVPAATVVRRAFALDTARHLSVAGRYLRAWAAPDRWVSWKWPAVQRGLKMIREFAPQALWSTYPIATAHSIGAALQRRSGLPWVADFRDPMAHDGYPPDAFYWAQYERVEREVFSQASRCVFTTAGAAALYRSRYPAAAYRVSVIENGYDEPSFQAAEHSVGLLTQADRPLQPGALTLLHSGTVYPVERDPAPLFAALRQLHDAGAITPGRLQLRFRGSQHDGLLNQLATRFDVAAYIDLRPPCGYTEALAEMLRADGLLLLQGADCALQIPAKAYEYLRAGRPVLCFASAGSDTAALLHAAGLPVAADLHSATAIARELASFLSSVAGGTAARPDATAVRAAARPLRTAALAAVLDAACATAPVAGAGQAA